jgi:hypothetical protein
VRALSEQEKLRIEINKRKALAKLRRKQSIQRQQQQQLGMSSQSPSCSQGQPFQLAPKQLARAPVASTVSSHAASTSSGKPDLSKKPFRKPLAPLFVAPYRNKPLATEAAKSDINREPIVQTGKQTHNSIMNIR